eukprot:NODE_3372_length_1363_cov_53.604032_g2936_i0.p1 GENE.NODE_3372_length_1363_cov_53.604032_g2936_i0~~NODE_3372_length_1363_cov_53.604032_g2936_i0.p1  ORF type:complete len:394 (-),score=115.41 NODE_3372_length_1363_cov_53.604032_g2936_i0:180-1193(-)
MTKRQEEANDAKEYQKNHPNQLPSPESLKEKYDLNELENEAIKEEETADKKVSLSKNKKSHLTSIDTKSRPYTSPTAITSNSPSALPSPPRTAPVVERINTPISRPGTTLSFSDSFSNPKNRLLADLKTRKQMLSHLVTKQEVHNLQLQQLTERQNQIHHLQNQVDELQKNHQQQQIAQLGDSDIDVEIPPELDNQLKVLSEQQKKIEELHKALMSTHNEQLENIKQQRHQQLLSVQEDARRHLMQQMSLHNHMEALSKFRQQQRHQRSNALLWNRNRYEPIKTKLEVISPPPQSTTPPTITQTQSFGTPPRSFTTIPSNSSSTHHINAIVTNESTN